MSRTTSATGPLSYYEVLSTFWAAACAARGTDLRGQPLFNFDVLSPVPYGFVAELGSKLRPAGIEHGFRQAGSGKCAGIDVADANAPVFLHEACRQAMEEVLATVRDFGVDGLNPEVAPRALCDRERRFMLSIDARRLDLLTRGERRQRSQAEVDPNLASPMLRVLQNSKLQIEIPATTGIPSERTAADFAGKRPAQPQSVSAPEQDHSVAIQMDGPRCLEGNPSQGSPATPSRPFAVFISRNGELLADRLYCIRVQAQQPTTAERESDQVKTRWPALVVAPSGFLYLTTIVPHLVDCPSLLLKPTTGGPIPDPVTICQHHINIVVDHRCANKIDAKHRAEISTTDLAFGASGRAVRCGFTRRDSVLTDVFRGRLRIDCLGRPSGQALAHSPRSEQRGFQPGDDR